MKFFEQAAFPWVEDEFAAQVGGLATEQGQEHYSPSHDRIDSDGAGQFGCALMLMGFDTATTFQNAMPFFDAPPVGLLFFDGAVLRLVFAVEMRGIEMGAQYAQWQAALTQGQRRVQAGTFLTY